MAHTKGKLHCHDEAIHLMYSENDKVIDHTCIALINEFLSKKEIDYWAKHICRCVNSHYALLEACKELDKWPSVWYEYKGSCRFCGCIPHNTGKHHKDCLITILREAISLAEKQ